MAKALVFDFDGVIVPSEQIKVDGYSLIFSEFGEEVPQAAVIAEARREFADGKGNRFDIIRGIFKRLGVSEGLEEKVSMYVQRYGKLVQGRIEALSVNAATRATLERLAAMCPLYINSNNPDEALQNTLRSLDVEKYFKAVYGSSHTKVENFKTIAQREGVQATDMVFIGDGEGDRNAAQEFGCEFIGIATELNGWPVGMKAFPVVAALPDIEGCLG